MSTEPIIGIDLGTTNSVVAAVIDGQATVLEEDGQAILPSVVAMDSNNKLITGTVAPAHHTPWKDALDDTLESYLQN